MPIAGRMINNNRHQPQQQQLQRGIKRRKNPIFGLYIYIYINSTKGAREKEREIWKERYRSWDFHRVCLDSRSSYLRAINSKCMNFNKRSELFSLSLPSSTNRDGSRLWWEWKQTWWLFFFSFHFVASFLCVACSTEWFLLIDLSQLNRYWSLFFWTQANWSPFLFMYIFFVTTNSRTSFLPTYLKSIRPGSPLKRINKRTVKTHIVTLFVLISNRLSRFSTVLGTEPNDLSHSQAWLDQSA